MRCLVLALAAALSACTAANPDEWAGDMARKPDQPIMFPSTDMATDSARGMDMARDAWVCVPAISHEDGKPCGCAGLPCCRDLELAEARTANGLEPYPNDYCNGVTVTARPIGYAESCERFGVNVWRCVIVR